MLQSAEHERMEMEIIQATESLVSKYADEFAGLIHATGPVTYDYQFVRRELFDQIVKLSWGTPGTLFAYDETRLAVDGDELLGMVVCFRGPEFLKRRKALPPLWQPLIDAGEITPEELAEIGRRTFLCSYLNAAIPSAVYYIHAVAVKEAHRGRGIGAKLLHTAIEQGKQAGLRGLHLDVLSDNPAVEFYRAMGFECLVETVAPIPLDNGVPMEMRMAINFS